MAAEGLTRIDEALRKIRLVRGPAPDDEEVDGGTRCGTCHGRSVEFYWVTTEFGYVARVVRPCVHCEWGRALLKQWMTPGKDGKVPVLFSEMTADQVAALYSRGETVPDLISPEEHQRRKEMAQQRWPWMQIK